MQGGDALGLGCARVRDWDPSGCTGAKKRDALGLGFIGVQDEDHQESGCRVVSGMQDGDGLG